MSYPFRNIEEKWQNHWEKNKTFRTPEDRTRPKYYVLDMFPYPSGAGLHVGHPEGYTATDIVARYKRMKGFNVLHPMGWDAFGLPAERYAMKTGIHPSITTEQNIGNFRRQLKALGFSYDWEREINTTDPGYYKWTQWIFLQIFNSWFDPEVGRARPIRELKIPAELKKKGREKDREAFVNERRLAYVAEMPVNWCAELGTVLANEEVEEWTSKGYTVERKPMRQWMLRITAYAERLLEDLKHVQWPAGTLELQKNWIGKSTGASVHFPVKGSSGTIEVFTTRPDTLFGVTYMVLSPEHPLTASITSSAQKKAVEKYIEETKLKSDLERQVKGEKEEKTGVFTGGYALHPFTGEEIPVWIADYVLMGYGTGAIMAVPAHDERDFAFATKMNLPVRVVVKPVSGAQPTDAFSGAGINVNSQFLDGLATQDAIARMIAELEQKGIGSGRVNYKLRDWLFSRQRYWGEPVPVSFTESGAYVAEKDNNLPLVLPPSDDFQPSKSGESPLAKIKDWVLFEDPKLGTMRRETNTMPQWAGSSWYYLRFIDPANKKKLVDPAEESYWMGDHGVDLYIGGAEHAVLHLLYARFWHKVLFDLGHVKSIEPFQKLVHQGLILGEDGQKMSKSLGNVVNPDDVLVEFGADSFRLYEMFLGPLEMSKPWSTKAIGGVYRFLSRAWRLYTLRDPRDDEESSTNAGAALDPELLREPEGERKTQIERLTHKTIQKVTEDIEKLSFNTAISSLMVFVNEVTADKKIGRFAAESFLILLSPFAPHIAEELWEKLGHNRSIAHEQWPAFDPSKTAADEIEIVFQVNGKVRGKARLAPGASDEELKSAALADESVRRAVEGKEIRKAIVVKNKLVNLVV